MEKKLKVGSKYYLDKGRLIVGEFVKMIGASPAFKPVGHTVYGRDEEGLIRFGERDDYFEDGMYEEVKEVENG